MSRRSAHLPRPHDDRYVFRLYVSGSTGASVRAVVNARKLCETHLKDRYDLEILILADHVDRATEDQIIAAPTLIKLSPLPVRRFIGDMSDPERILSHLNIDSMPSLPSVLEHDRD